MTQWEYMSLRWDMVESLASVIEDWGNKGWELVSAIPEQTGGVVLLLKRPKEQEVRRGFGTAG